MLSSDIEIYLKEDNLTTLSHCLETLLGPCSAWQTKGKIARCIATNQHIPITFYSHAVGKWHCLHFGSDKTPWADDLACAIAISLIMKGEIRCAPSFWQENDTLDNTDQWLSVLAGNVRDIHWKTDCKQP